MANKLKLTTIKLETKDGREVELSIAEAKDLHDQLHQLFGDTYVPQAPIVIERDRLWPYWWGKLTSTPRDTGQPPIVWCQNTSLSGLTLSYGGREE